MKRARSVGVGDIMVLPDGSRARVTGCKPNRAHSIRIEFDAGNGVSDWFMLEPLDRIEVA